MGYNTPIVLFIFNRPELTDSVFSVLRELKPSKLYIVSDGPRKNVITDNELVIQCRSIVSQVDWDCIVQYNYSEFNLGCQVRINSGIEWVFKFENEAIFIEDDCLPTLEFFEFAEWGLITFRDNLSIGMISGSNLIDFKNLDSSINFNGFSKYISIWGWGTWKRVWSMHRPYISLNDFKKIRGSAFKDANLAFFEKIFWNEVFKCTILLGSTWDFQLQLTFFSNNLLSVYPKCNLVQNIGYGKDGTHTNSDMPDFVKKSLPELNRINTSFMSDIKVTNVIVNEERDKILIKHIWTFSIFTSFRLIISNIYRFIVIQ